jgi:hypothetical protein
MLKAVKNYHYNTERKKTLQQRSSYLKVFKGISTDILLDIQKISI